MNELTEDERIAAMQIAKAVRMAPPMWRRVAVWLAWLLVWLVPAAAMWSAGASWLDAARYSLAAWVLTGVPWMALQALVLYQMVLGQRALAKIVAGLDVSDEVKDE